MSIHPTAVVHKGAEIDASAEVGPFCVIGPRVKIGAHSRLMAHVVVDNHTTLGARTVVHPFASIGGVPQDLKYRGEPARLWVGDDTVVREYVTLNIGTEAGHMETRVGNRCLLMAYAHVAHDCILGDNVILANAVALAGHVEIADHVTVGGLAAVHQFCRIGRWAFVGGGAMVAQDVPPFCIAQGDRACLAGLNVVGLRRAGWPRAKVNEVRQAFRTMFLSGASRQDGLAQVAAELAEASPEVAELCDFVRGAARGVCAPRMKGDVAPEAAQDAN